MIYVYIDANNPPVAYRDPIKIGEEQTVITTLVNADQYNSRTVTLKYKLCTVSAGAAVTLYSYLKDAAGDDITMEVELSANQTVVAEKRGMIIPNVSATSSYYGVQVEVSTTINSNYDRMATPDTFEVIGAMDLKSDCLLLTFLAGPYGCVINTSTLAVTATAPHDADLTALSCTFTISDGATLSVGGLDKTSPATLNLATSPTQIVVTAEDGTTNTYGVTISKSGSPVGTWDFNTYDAKTSVSPDTVGMGGVLSVVFTCLNDGTGDYLGTEGHRIPLLFKYDGTTQFADYIELNKAIPKKPATGFSFTEFKKDIIIPTGLAVYGLNYSMEFKTDGTSSHISKTVKIVNYINDTKTKVYSEKENIFTGNRNYRSSAYFALNNDLFAANPDNVREFYLMDSSTQVRLWGSSVPEEWNIQFIVQVGPDPVIFKTLDIELGMFSGGSIALKKIEYATNRQIALQEPFYSATDSEWNPWNPIYKDEKWHLPVRQEYDADAIIQYKKLKGTYLRITLTGQSDDQIVLRNVVTKILKIFN